tara:strand:+ start:29787 stop:30584 length:798 start_codon:yes stop_codon:yes gene_type:complete
MSQRNVLPIDMLYPSPYQPRRHFAEQSLDELKASILLRGVIQSIVVRPRAAGGYEIVCGERRWRAAGLACLHEIPCEIRTLSDEEAIDIIVMENLHRQDLNPIEEADSYAQYRELGFTQEQIAQRIGKERTYVTKYLKLLNLRPIVQDWVREGRLSAGHAICLTTLPSEQQQKLAEQCMTRQLSVRALERLCRGLHTINGSPRQTPTDPNITRFAQQIGESIGAEVIITPDAKHPQRGELRIHYGSLEALEGVAERLGVGHDHIA